MTEKRSEYQKKQRKSSQKSVFDKVRSAFVDDNEPKDNNVDVVPGFKRDKTDEKLERRSLKGNGEPIFSPKEEKRTFNEEKRLRLKKRLNSAILIVFILIILVLLALFHL